ncbi:MAG: energy transducer TonB [Cyclobacteriaceae bacterium]|nr:energy transducer TonB [Cyclobacteriaceae bacterium]
MEPNKYHHSKSSQYSGLFFNIGLVIALGLVLVAFEWKFVEQKSTVNLESTNAPFMELVEDIPVTEQPLPHPPQIQLPQVIEVPDEEEIEVELEINLDVEMTEETVLDEVIFAEAPEEETAEEIFSIVKKIPSFPGGLSHFHKYVSKNLEYPTKARIEGVEGKVTLLFIVGANGEISQVEVLQGIGFGCDEEAIRVMQSSPNWIPGEQRGRKVKVRLVVSLMFDLSSK